MDLHHMKLRTIRNNPLLYLRMTLHQDITNAQYLMEDITRFPDIEGLALEIKPKGHSFGASVFHVLRMCTGVRRLRFTLMDVISHTEVTLSFPYLSDSCYAFIFFWHTYA
jgi:chloramphenicol O-acetyltransferase